MHKRNKLGIALIVVLLVAAAGGALIGKKKQTAVTVVAKTPQALEFLPSDLAHVKTAELRQTLALSGALRAVNQVSVKARVAGDVLDVLVREGEPVQAGQVLVKMDIREYQSKVNQAAGALAAARGQLEIAIKARDSNRALLEKNFISKNAFDNAESQYAIARANVDSARAALDVTQKAAADTVIRAPISGLISMRTVQPGEKVSADNRLVDVVDLRQMELEAAVPTSEITSVSLNQEVEVRFAGVLRPMPGKVVRINPATQAGSRSVLVYVQIDNPQNQLKVGMFGEAQLTLTKKSGVLAAPQTAIRNDAGTSFVYAVENGMLAKKPVRTGISGFAENEPAVEILDGVQNGTRIIRNNLGELLAGTPVKIVGTAGPGNGNGNGDSSSGNNGGNSGGNSGGNHGGNNGGGVSGPADADRSPATTPAGGNVATR